MGPRTTLVIVEDDQMLGELMSEECAYLASDIAWFESADSAMAATKAQPNKNQRVWLIDLHLSEGSQGLELSKYVRKNYPANRIIVMTRDRKPELAWMALRVYGADAFLVKSQKNARLEIQRAIEMLIDGQSYENEISRSLPEENPSVISKLTDTQRLVLFLFAQGHGTTDVAKIAEMDPAAVSRIKFAVEKKTRRTWHELINAALDEAWVFASG